jgi:hypothetical protein
MAQRLEAALRKPGRAKEPRATEPTPPPPPEVLAPLDLSEATPEQSDLPPANPEPKPAAPKSLYDSLEQEMASLLGRPPDKP